MKIAILGAGNVGSSICNKLRFNHEIYLGTREPRSDKILQIIDDISVFAMSHAEAVYNAQVVIIALHPPHLKALMDAELLDLESKVVIDCTNQIFEKVSPDFDSATQAISTITGCTAIVKAFNTTGAENISTTKDGTVDTFVAGEDSAKEVAIELAEEIGFNPIDAGGLENTHALEEMARIWVTVCRQRGDFNTYFKLQTI